MIRRQLGIENWIGHEQPCFVFRRPCSTLARRDKPGVGEAAADPPSGLTLSLVTG